MSVVEKPPQQLVVVIRRLLATRHSTAAMFSIVLVSRGRPDDVLFSRVKFPALISLNQVLSVEKPVQVSGKVLARSEWISDPAYSELKSKHANHGCPFSAARVRTVRNDAITE